MKKFFVNFKFLWTIQKVLSCLWPTKVFSLFSDFLFGDTTMVTQIYRSPPQSHNNFLRQNTYAIFIRS